MSNIKLTPFNGNSNMTTNTNNNNISNYMNYSLNNSIYNAIITNKPDLQQQQQLNVNNNRKRLKPPESLTKSPLSSWNEPIEDWRALVTEDIFDKDRLNDSIEQQNNGKLINTPSRRYTMNIFDISRNLTTLNIFSQKNKLNNNRTSNINNNNNNNSFSHNRHNKTLNEHKQKVSKSWQIVKSRLMTPIYMKSGPGYHDFGFVSLQELVKVRKHMQ